MVGIVALANIAAIAQSSNTGEVAPFGLANLLVDSGEMVRGEITGFGVR